MQAQRTTTTTPITAAKLVEQAIEAKLVEQAIEATTKRQSLVGTAASILGVPADKLCDLLRNVWKPSKNQPPLTDQEMFTGISLIARYGLDPIAREVYVTRGKGGIFAIISIDGWIKVLDRTDHYDGFDVEYHHDDNGKLVWIETCIYSTKRSHPTKYRAYADEYARVAGVVANDLPSHMLRVFSLRHAARLFSPIGGNVLTEEEALYVARNEPQQLATGNGAASLDDLTAKLAAPLPPPPPPPADDLPDTSYEPPPSDEEKIFQEYLEAIAGMTESGDPTKLYDALFGPDSIREFTPQQNEIAAKAANDKELSLLPKRGHRAKQGGSGKDLS